MGVNKKEQAVINDLAELYVRYIEGGPLHVVVGDGNVEDRHIEWNKANLKGYCKDDEEMQLCTRILDGLLMFKERKRHSILSQATKKARGAE